MKYPKLRELKEAITSLFSKPYTTKFPKKPSIPFPRFRGRIEFNPEKCIGCGACVEVCPANAREIKDDLEKKVRRIIYHLDMCILCGQCVAYCITKEGIRHTLDYDMVYTDKKEFYDEIEKELVFCERCGRPVTTKDHLLWIAEKLGELSYANPTLLLAKLSELETVELQPERKQEAYRADHMRILCPSCRREVYLREIWGY